MCVAKSAGSIGSMKWEGAAHAQDQMQRALLLTVKWDRYAPQFEQQALPSSSLSTLAHSMRID